MSCIKFSSKKKNFNDAKKDCENKNAHLFTIRNNADRDLWKSKLLEIKEAFEEDGMDEMLAWFETKMVWIGLQYSAERERWHWINDKPIRVQILNRVASENKCPMFANYRGEEEYKVYGSFTQCFHRGTLLLSVLW